MNHHRQQRMQMYTLTHETLTSVCNTKLVYILMHATCNVDISMYQWQLYKLTHARSTSAKHVYACRSTSTCTMNLVYILSHVTCNVNISMFAVTCVQTDACKVDISKTCIRKRVKVLTTAQYAYNLHTGVVLTVTSICSTCCITTKWACALLVRSSNSAH